MKDAPPREAVRVGGTWAPGARIGWCTGLRGDLDVMAGSVFPPVEEIGETPVDHKVLPALPGIEVAHAINQLLRAR